MKKILFLITLMCALSICIQPVYGVTAYPYPVEYELPDGTFITIKLLGDEKIKLAQTVDGYTVLVANDGFYEYARKDDRGDLKPSGIRVSDVQNRTPEEEQFISGLTKGLFYSPSQVSIMKQIWKIDKSEREYSAAFPTIGNRKLLCILIGYDDLAFTKTQADFNNLFNQIGYNSNGATGSVKEFYSEVSYNQLNLTVDVAGPYTAANSMAHYGANNASGNDVRPRDLVAEAVDLADPDVDYADYDNDNDGSVDGVYVIYAGYGEEAGGGTDAIWAHAWNIPAVTLDGKIVSRYSCSPELSGNSGSNITNIGVICHEFGHVLGAADFYDTDQGTGGSYTGTGKWDLMAAGSWNNNGKTPAHPNPYIKIYSYSWAAAITLTSPATIILSNAAENSNSFYRYTSTTSGEYFLIEYREKLNFDANLPGKGMMIYHVHKDIVTAASSNNVNDTHPQKMYPVCANAGMDPTNTPASYGSISSSGTPFPGSSGIKEFTDKTLPSAKSWAGADTEKSVTNIEYSASKKEVTFDFMAGIQVALVLDRSGSMGANYMNAAKTAAKSFVSLMQIDDWLTVTSFSSSATVNFQFAQIKSEQIRNNAINAINGIYASGTTSIGAGILSAQTQLNKGNTDKVQGMVLLSDGYENRSPYVSQVIPTIPGNTDIYTIALGPNSDQTLLNNIASATGGFYSYAPNTNRLSLIYNSIRAKVMGQQTLALFFGLLAQGQNIIQSVSIDGGVTFANFSLTWPGSDMDLVLTDPNGQVIDHTVSDPDISFTEGGTFENYTVVNPVPGQWSMSITAVAVPGQEQYTATVTAESSLTMDIAFDKSNYGTNDQILVTAVLKDGDQAVTGAIVTTDVTTPVSNPAPSGSRTQEPEESVELIYIEINENHGEYIDEEDIAYYDYDVDVMDLYDDGLHGDGAANDGIYGNYYTNTSHSGSYTFDVSASGTAPVSGGFSRIDSKSTTVTTVQSISVTTPQSGVNWYADCEHAVEWSSTNISGNVNIYLSTDGGSTFNTSLALDVVDDGSEMVMVPVTNSGACRIKVLSVDFPGITGTNPGNFSIMTVGDAGVISGTSVVDAGDSDVIYSVAGIVNATDYMWNYSGTGVTIHGSGENITIDFASNATSGILKVKADNACQSTAWSPDFQITVNSSGGDDLFTDSGQGLGVSNHTSVALGDLDGDGDIDAAVTNDQENEPNKVWLNDGTGNFTDSGLSFGSAKSWGIALGDLDDDGDLDGFIANDGANKVFINDGIYTGDNGQNLGNHSTHDVALADIDGDGDLDAVVANNSTGQPNRVWLNNGYGMFTDAGLSFGTASSYSLALGDLDDDGDIDGFVSNDGPNKVYLNAGPYTTDNGQNLGNASSKSVQLGDMDGDGDLDAVVANNAAGQPNIVWLNNGSGTFTNSGLNFGNNISMYLAIGDLDADGDLDGFIANSGANKVYLNAGIYTANNGQSLGSGNSYGVALADLDNDGDLDAFVANYDGPCMVWFNQTFQGQSEYSKPDVGTTFDPDQLESTSNYELTNYPDPFNIQTKVRFKVSKTERTTLKVYNIYGREVAVLYDNVAEAGNEYLSVFNGENLPEGIYILYLKSGDKVAAKEKMMLVK